MGKKCKIGIVGSPALLKSMFTELIEAGCVPYNVTTEIPKGYCITQNSTSIKYQEDAKIITYARPENSKKDITFNLPEDYNKALAYVKEIISDKYWEEPKETYPFEVGKWYYFRSFNRKDNTNIARCEKFEKEVFHTDNWVMLGDHTTNGTDAWKIDDMSDIRIATEDEVQKYLPDGHPSKKVKFEKYKWYYVRSTFPWYIKYVQGNTGTVEFYEYIDVSTKEYKKSVNLAHVCNVKEVREVSVSEVRKYLPDGHPEKKLRLDELIPDKVYWSCNSYYPNGHLWRFESHTGTFIRVKSGIYDNLTNFAFGAGVNNANWEKMREATKEEISWLEACEKAGTTVPRDKAHFLKYPEMPFGDSTCTVNLEKDIVKIGLYTVNKEELNSIIKWYESSPSIKGYKVTPTKISVGCKSGSLEELMAIWKLLK